MYIIKKNHLNYLKNNMKEVGELYEAEKDALPFIKESTINTLKDFVKDLYNTLTLATEVKWVEGEPYDYLGEGHFDIFKDFSSGFIKVPTGDDNSNLFGDVNLKFRATHDIIHAITQKSFSYKDEVDTFSFTAQMFMMWSQGIVDREQELVILQILRSEIVYQSAFKNLQTNNNIKQKIVLTN